MEHIKNAAHYDVQLVHDALMTDAVEELRTWTSQKMAVYALIEYQLASCDEALIVRTTDNVIAMAALGMHYERSELMLRSLYVLPTYRGQRIGTRLLYESVRRAEERGFSPLGIEVVTEGMWTLLRGLPRTVVEKQCRVEDVRRQLDELFGGVSPAEYRKQYNTHDRSVSRMPYGSESVT